MGVIKRKTEVTEAKIAAIVSFLDTVEGIADENYRKYRKLSRVDNSQAVVGSVAYWRNVASGLRWAQSIAASLDFDEPEPPKAA